MSRTGSSVWRVRTVVVGASSGLGRSIGIGLAARGHQVALLARRRERLVDAAAEAGPDAIVLTCDVTDEASCTAAMQEAADRMGGVDGLVYATGVGTLGRLADLRAETWAHTFATNVTGAALITAAALPHLTATRGVAAYLSSVSASMTPPWPGLGAYIVSKAALDKLVEAWRVEQPGVGFTRVAVGECGGGDGPSGSEFATGWDQDLAAEIAPVWFERGLVSGSLIDVDELIRVVDLVLGCGATASLPSVSITPRPQG